MPQPNFLDGLTSHISKVGKGNHKLLSKYTVVSEKGKVLAEYERTGTTWTRIK